MEKTLPRIALISGGSSGIGFAVACTLAKQQIKVVVADIAPPEEQNFNFAYHYCDVTKGEDVGRLYNYVTENYGVPEIIILSAGIGIHEQLLEGDPEKWQQVMNVNVMGVLRIVRAFVPLLYSKKRGDVVFISSVSSSQPYKYGAVYSASKTAVDIIAETLRLETSPYLRVMVVKAGVTDTGFFKQSPGHSIESIGVGNLSPVDIAEDIWYALCKEKGKMINTIVTRPSNQVF